MQIVVDGRISLAIVRARHGLGLGMHRFDIATLGRFGSQRAQPGAKRLDLAQGFIDALQLGAIHLGDKEPAPRKAFNQPGGRELTESIAHRTARDIEPPCDRVLVEPRTRSQATRYDLGNQSLCDGLR